ncbi:MAG TPA: phosphoribosylanthranilate isomerase [Desulfobacteraceae bacterium]|nr:phosphoribosylanthranilate isomerase [Desulfobacteraceae bacterium]
MDNIQNTPQIKICGLTKIDEALGCANLGADAIGLVFYPKSPRNVTIQMGREISRALPPKVTTVGVFVDETFLNIMKIVEFCGLKAVQLHGNEPCELVNRLRKENIIVVKALFANKKPFLADTGDYNPSAYLVECGKGILPGGNAKTWNWEKASRLNTKCPIILAGGLAPENAAKAVAACLPDAVDISSGVESSPGRKDLKKTDLFINAILQCSLPKPICKIF